MNQLKDYILVLEDIIPYKLCDDIIQEYINSEEWRNALIGNNKVSKEIRNCTGMNISSNEIIKKNIGIRKKIDLDIFNCIKKSMNIYNLKFKNTKISKDFGYNLLKYEKGGFYSEHIDAFFETNRTLSCSLILNNDFNGGEFSFFNNKLVYPLKKGNAILFPSNFMYPHSVLPVTKGTRYSIVTWLI